MVADKRKVFLLTLLIVGSGVGRGTGAEEAVQRSPGKRNVAVGGDIGEAGIQESFFPGEKSEAQETSIWEAYSGGTRLALIFLLLSLQALVAAAETSFLALGEVRARQLAERSRPGKVLLRLLANPTLVLPTLLFSITLLLTFADEQATLLAHSWLGPEAEWAILVLVPVIVALIAIPFAELLPILYAAHAPERVSQRAAIPVQVLCWILRPVVFLLEGTAYGVLRLIGISHPSKRRPLTEDQIKEAILTSSEQGQLPPEQGHILRSVFAFSDTIAKEAMVPRTDVTFLHMDMTIGEALQIVTEDVHSRFPVYQETPDRIIGLLHVKDLLPYVSTEENQRLSEVWTEQDIHPVLLTPETTHLTDLLAQMQREQVTLAVVVDEHGGVEGIVSIEDILEELVGDILDQEDEEEPQLHLVEGDEPTYLCHGRYSIDKLNRTLGLDLPTKGYDTVAGFVLAQLGEFPEAEGTEVVFGRLVLTVVELDREKHRINRVRIRIQPPKPGKEEEDPGRNVAEED